VNGPLRLLAGVLLSAAGCASPEAARARGGGAGGDVGNRKSSVEFHAGARPYYKTPCRAQPLPCQEPKPALAATPKRD
jgi:hypothetical protein